MQFEHMGSIGPHSYLHKTLISRTPINYATYWALSHSIILQTFSEQAIILLRQIFGG